MTRKEPVTLEAGATCFDAAATPIQKRYLLVTVSLPLYIDPTGRRYINALWLKDLAQHRRYLPNLAVACPFERGIVPHDCVQIDASPTLGDVRFIEIPLCKSTLDALVKAPRTLRALWTAIRQADIVHCGVAGWPIPGAWYVLPLAARQKVPTVIYVESAFWRKEKKGSLSSRIRSAVFERINRTCVRRATVSFFTHQRYKDSLLSPDDIRGHVIHASWIDRKNILSEISFASSATAKSSEGKLRAIFAGRIEPEKGLTVLLRAAELLRDEKINFEINILGSGSQIDECKRFVNEKGLTDYIFFLGTVPYGEDFFRTLRRHHVLVVPSLTDEQPRIVYDSFSQGVPVVASNTDGLRECVSHGRTGFLVEPGDVTQLAGELHRLSRNIPSLSLMGENCLVAARSLTHEEMHARRKKVLESLL